MTLRENIIVLANLGEKKKKYIYIYKYNHKTHEGVF